MGGKALNKQEMDSIDLAKFVFAFAVIHIHAGGGTVVHPILASIVNSFDSLAVPFFFIVAGYFFFNRIEKLENETQKKEYAISYLLKTLKIYFVWSVVLLPSRLILSKSSMLGVLLKWFRTVFFIGDAQLWYLNALLIGLILILILKKSKINDTWIMLIGVVFFIAGMKAIRWLLKLILVMITLPLILAVWLAKWFVVFLHHCSAWIFYLLGSVLLATAILSYLMQQSQGVEALQMLIGGFVIFMIPQVVGSVVVLLELAAVMLRQVWYI